MATTKFEIAAADKEAAAKDRQHLDVIKVFEVEGQTYAAVRPPESAWVPLMRAVYAAKKDEQGQGIAGIKFLDICLDENRLRNALVDTGDYEPTDDDPEDAELNAAGELLAQSNQRLNDRMFDDQDDFGGHTLVQIMYSITEEWSGNPTGSLPASSSGRRRTGARSTARSSSKASTSSKSSPSRRRAT